MNSWMPLFYFVTFKDMPLCIMSQFERHTLSPHCPQCEVTYSCRVTLPIGHGHRRRSSPPWRWRSVQRVRSLPTLAAPASPTPILLDYVNAMGRRASYMAQIL